MCQMQFDCAREWCLGRHCKRRMTSHQQKVETEQGFRGSQDAYRKVGGCGKLYRVQTILAGKGTNEGWFVWGGWSDPWLRVNEVVVVVATMTSTQERIKLLYTLSWRRRLLILSL